MLRIHQLFFLNTLGLFLGTLLISSLISFFALKTLIINQSERHLIQSIELLQPQLLISTDYDVLANSVAKTTHLRVTIIREDGSVIAESNSDKTKMENHANRIEVMQALTEPYGMSVRYSKTIKTDFIYIAKKVATPQGTVFIRLAMSLENLMEYFYSLWFKLLAVFIVFIIFALFISYNISKKARHDIIQITRFLDEISNKNYKAVLKPEFFREFLQISIMLKNLVKKLHNRDKQKRKYTAKLRLINKQQNDILSAISHEFKNPMAAIMGYAETLHDDLNIDPKIREKFLDKILSNSHKIIQMLDRLALSVKLENNDLSMKPATFDLNDVCTDVISVLKGKYPYRDIRYVGTSKTVYADKTMIELVITNLMDNALKYSEDDVILKLSEHEISVTDKGIGIAPSELEKITSKFYRVQKNRWDNSMGLGLAIVTYILKLHDTLLTIQSTLGVGSTFGFSLENLVPPKKPLK